MSYIFNLDSKFMIKAENVPAAIAALKKYYVDEDHGDEYYYEEDFADLSYGLENFGWTIEINENSDAVNCKRANPGNDYFESEFEMLDIIAPYVEKGSYIELIDEEGVWREYFNGKTRERYAANLSYEYDNSYLSWEDLKLLEGCPVWIEWVSGTWKGAGKWAIVGKVFEDHLTFAATDKVQGYGGHLYKREIGDTWKVYRKEKNNY